VRDEAFDPSRHDYKRFTCDREPLTDYLRKYAKQDQKRGVANIYVLTDDGAPREIIGYYTLSAAELHIDALPESVAKKLPKYPVPCYRLGRLAVSEQHVGRGIGPQLLASAVQRCLEAKQVVASYALLVDALDERAQGFYVKHGFQPLANQPMVLWMPLPRQATAQE